MAEFDFRNPQYTPVFQQRIEALARIRAEPSALPALKTFYRDHPARFVADWGLTYDPRNPELGLPATVPFVLFPKQVEWIEWVLDRWRSREDGLTEKSRDAGISWLAVSLSATLCLFRTGLTIGFGSRSEDDVDKSADPSSLFWKARFFLSGLPPEFRGGYDAKTSTSHMRISIPETGSTLIGDAGDNIGRGARTSLYFLDEAAHLPRPESVDAALSQTTNCRIDVSTPRGNANAFTRKRFGGKTKVFTFRWRDDPRKDDAWYAKQVERLDPVTLAQEVDLDYAASVEGVLIPSAWVQAAVDAHIKLGITPSGSRSAALDVADQGQDTNAFCGAHGIVVEVLEEWSGKGDDIFATVARAFALCDQHGYTGFKYDADGLGAGVRGDARVLNERRDRPIQVEAFQGSEAPANPQREDVAGRRNADLFANRKAQGWWGLRTRFENTHRAVTKGISVSPDELISIPSDLPLRNKLLGELSQPTYTVNAAGKFVIDKAPSGSKSPNLADAVMIRFAATSRPPMMISDAALTATAFPL